MKFINTAIGATLTGAGVALTYFVFEAATRKSIEFFWIELFNTENNWVLIPFLSVIFSFMYFGVKQFMADDSGKKDSKIIGNYFKVLCIGYLSLLAGASLGPEAILIPASLLVGALISKKLLRGGSYEKGLLGMVAMAALFTAFFGSMLAGLLGIYLGKAEMKIKINIKIAIFSIFGIASAYYLLAILEPSSFFVTPNYGWDLKASHIIGLFCISLIGAGITVIMSKLKSLLQRVLKRVKYSDWKKQALVAGLGVSLLYIAGGPYVRFTGNEAIKPLIQSAPEIGLTGLLVIILIKITAIIWSKESGYRGGLIFPTALVASAVTVTFQLYITDVSYIYGIIAFFVGAWFINRKSQVLF